ncbi:MAG TPA: RagB/SusD family nutrient uptake outer membrane protein [Arachidicoccus sp.]|nr:RagB/SusD family nutrient uptake outer membrane protein [Arachidicoccus sp.]
MKNKIIRLLFFITAFQIFGCTRRLDEVPKSIISPDQFYKTGEESIQGVNGVYRMLPSLFNAGGFWNVTMAGADIILQDKTDGNLTQLYKYTAFDDSGAGSVWKNCYTTIMNANLFINRVKNAPIEDSLKNRLLGEAKFLRAMQYYFLTNIFGDVPLWLDELEVENVVSLPRAPVADVQKQIVEDLIQAAAGLPNRFTGEDVGRASKAAALTLLAKEYLMEKNWAAAREAAQQVIRMPEYALMDNYGDNFDIHGRNCKESIFEIQYLRDAVNNVNYTTNNLCTWFMPPKDAPGKFAGVDFGNILLQSYANYYPTKKFVQLFEPGDKRKESILAYGFNGKPFNRLNVNDMPYFGIKFWDLENNNTASGKNLPFLRLADNYMALAEAENELGNAAASAAAINVLRTRAGLPSIAILSKEAMRTKIMHESAIEFSGEFCRKWDLNRWGKLIEAVKSVAADNPEGAANIDAHYLYYPINTDELIKNTNLEQNKGY